MDNIILISIIAGAITAFLYAIQGITEGLTAKRARYYELAFVTQLCALVIMAFLTIILHKTLRVDATAMLIALLLGLIYALSLHYYFRALKTGPMSIVAPISGSYAIIAVPIAVLFLGEVVTLTQYIGIALIIMGVFLIDFTIHHRSVKLIHRQYLFYAFLTLILWGVYMPIDSILISRSDWFVALFWELVFVNIFLAIMLFRKESAATLRTSMPTILKPSSIIGLCEALGGLVMNYGLDKGSVSLITPIITLSTVITVLFATFFLKQRIRRQQAIGIVCAIAGIFIIGY